MFRFLWAREFVLHCGIYWHLRVGKFVPMTRWFICILCCCGSEESILSQNSSVLKRALSDFWPIFTIFIDLLFLAVSFTCIGNEWNLAGIMELTDRLHNYFIHSIIKVSWRALNPFIICVIVIISFFTIIIIINDNNNNKLSSLETTASQ